MIYLKKFLRWEIGVLQVSFLFFYYFKVIKVMRTFYFFIFYFAQEGTPQVSFILCLLSQKTKDTNNYVIYFWDTSLTRLQVVSLPRKDTFKASLEVCSAQLSIGHVQKPTHNLACKEKKRSAWKKRNKKHRISLAQLLSLAAQASREAFFSKKKRRQVKNS